jgi:hypothetical protein
MKIYEVMEQSAAHYNAQHTLYSQGFGYDWGPTPERQGQRTLTC